MTYIDYANRYWRDARANFASNNCAFLYFFLLDYVNGLRWQQPFRCPTALITATVRVSKQQVVNARQELVELGLIIFKEGASRQVPPVYYLSTGEEGESLPDLEKLSVGKSVGLTEENTVDKTVGEPHYKEIDKDENNKSHTQGSGNISIDCLEDYTSQMKIITPKTLLEQSAAIYRSNKLRLYSDIHIFYNNLGDSNYLVETIVIGIPNSVTVINDEVFICCASLTTLAIPSTVTSISSCFCGSDNPEDLYCYAHQSSL